MLGPFGVLASSCSSLLEIFTFLLIWVTKGCVKVVYQLCFTSTCCLGLEDQRIRFSPVGPLDCWVYKPPWCYWIKGFLPVTRGPCLCLSVCVCVCVFQPPAPCPKLGNCIVAHRVQAGVVHCSKGSTPLNFKLIGWQGSINGDLTHWNELFKDTRHFWVNKHGRVLKEAICWFLTAQHQNNHTEIILFKSLLGQLLKHIAT